MLRPGGRLVYVVPGPRHLYQLKQVLYDTPYENPVQSIDYPGLHPVDDSRPPHRSRCQRPAGSAVCHDAVLLAHPRDGAAAWPSCLS